MRKSSTILFDGAIQHSLEATPILDRERRLDIAKKPKGLSGSLQTDALDSVPHFPQTPALQVAKRQTQG